MSFLISAFLSEESSIPLLYISVISFLFGIFPWIFVPHTNKLDHFEAILVVVLGWIFTCLIGTIPYILWGGEFSFVNAVFESVSGYTTTGASILQNVEALPKGLLFWRSSTHWIGGIGIILFSMLFFSKSNTNKLVLFNIEVSDLAKQNFNFRVKQTLLVLLIVYVGLTFLETILLVLFGMNFFDAINHSFATIATGGFSTKNLSVAYYDNAPIEIIIMCFMVVSGIHFGILFATFTGGKNNVFKSEIVKYYILAIIVGILLISLNLYFTGTYSFAESLRYGSFQIVTLGTTTGFASAESSVWPLFAQMILIYFTIQCACVGSTSGGLKFDRVFIFFKTIKKQLLLFLHPRSVQVIKIDNIILDDGIENATLGFIVLYVLIIFLSTAALSMLNIDLMTSFSGTAACIGNVGPGLGKVSSLGNYGNLPDVAKIILSGDMLIGRLEIYSILSIILYRYWR